MATTRSLMILIALICRISPTSAFSVTPFGCTARTMSQVVSRSASSEQMVLEAETSSALASQLEGTCVVGGGLAGLAAAAALRNMAGISDVRVLERREDAKAGSAPGAAVQLGPNGLKALKAIGGQELLDQIYEKATQIQGNVILMPNKQSMTIPDTSVQDTGLPQVLIPWSSLHSLLKDLLPEDCITFGIGSDICGYTVGESESGDAAVVNPVNEKGEAILSTLSAPLLIAADGIYSTFQALLHADDTMLTSQKQRQENIKDGGRVNIKAVAPANLGADYEPGMTYAFFSPAGVACFAGPAGEGATYWAISLPDQSDGTRFVEQGSIEGFAAVKEKLLSQLRELEDESCQFAIDMIEKTDANSMYIARSEEREHLGSSLVSTDGRVVLVGDAAHSMSPAYGQAANFAFEDVATLAKCFADGESVESALERYSSARVERCVEMQRRSVERTTKAARGEPTEDISKWIFEWEVNGDEA